MSLLVVGGSRGLGLAISHLLPKKGESLTIFSRSKPPKVVHAAWIQGDLSKSEDVEKIKGPFDTIVLSSGVYDENFPQMTEEAIKNMVDLHVLGTLHVSKRLPQMLHAGGAFVLLASSSAFPQSPSSHVAYVSTKWAVRGAGYAVSRLYPQFRTLVVSPEWIHTEPFCPQSQEWLPPLEPKEEDPLGRISCW